MHIYILYCYATFRYFNLHFRSFINALIKDNYFVIFE